MPTNKRLRKARKTINQLQYALLSQDQYICQIHKKAAQLQQKLIDQVNQSNLIKSQLTKTTNNYQNLSSKYITLEQRTAYLEKIISQMAQKNMIKQATQEQKEDSIKQKIIINQKKISEIIDGHNKATQKQRNLQQKQFDLEKEVISLKKVTQQLKSVKIPQEPPKKQYNQGNSFLLGSKNIFGQTKTIPKPSYSYASYDSYGGCPHFRNGGTCRNCL